MVISYGGEIYQCQPKRPKSWSKELTEKLQSILRSEFVGACIHFHKPNGRLASANGHSLPSTVCSWQSAFYSLSGDEKIPFSVFHDIYKIEQWKTQNINLHSKLLQRGHQKNAETCRKNLFHKHINITKMRPISQ